MSDWSARTFSVTLSGVEELEVHPAWLVVCHPERSRRSGRQARTQGETTCFHLKRKQGSGGSLDTEKGAVNARWFAYRILSVFSVPAQILEQPQANPASAPAYSLCSDADTHDRYSADVSAS
jgi:hypothetical protein